MRLLLFVLFTSLTVFANQSPTVDIISAEMRSGTTYMDIIFQINDPDDSTVKTRALAFIDGQRDLNKIIKPTAFVEGTASKIGDEIQTGTQHTLTWDVSVDWDIDLGNIEFEILCTDGALLPMEWIEINGNRYNTKYISSSKRMDALYWLYADNDEDLIISNSSFYATASAGSEFEGKALYGGGNTGLNFLVKKMDLRLAGEEDYDNYFSALDFDFIDTSYYPGQNSKGQMGFGQLIMDAPYELGSYQYKRSNGDDYYKPNLRDSVQVIYPLLTGFTFDGNPVEMLGGLDINGRFTEISISDAYHLDFNQFSSVISNNSEIVDVDIVGIWNKQTSYYDNGTNYRNRAYYKQMFVYKSDGSCEVYGDRMLPFSGEGLIDLIAINTTYDGENSLCGVGLKSDGTVMFYDGGELQDTSSISNVNSIIFIGSTEGTGVQGQLLEWLTVHDDGLIAYHHGLDFFNRTRTGYQFTKVVGASGRRTSDLYGQSRAYAIDAAGQVYIIAAHENYLNVYQNQIPAGWDWVYVGGDMSVGNVVDIKSEKTFDNQGSDSTHNVVYRRSNGTWFTGVNGSLVELPLDLISVTPSPTEDDVVIITPNN